MYYADGTPKKSLDAVRNSALAACNYVARIVRVDTGAVAAETAGSSAAGDGSATFTNTLSPESYQYAFRAYAAGHRHPGTAITRYSRPFEVAPPPDAASAEPAPPSPDSAPPSPDPASPPLASALFPTLIPTTSR